ncbi:MAG: DUF1013 domain-containing protein, partial [Pseudomonadota bacterium]
AGVRGIDPIANAQLKREEIDKAQDDPNYRMKLSRPKTVVATKAKKAPRYTPVSKRQNRPDAIAWMVRNHPEVSDAQISKLLGTTKTTIQSVRDRSHWNSSNITPQDPVGLGLCSQIELDAVVKKAAAKAAKTAAKTAPDTSATIEPVEPAAPIAPEPAEDSIPDEIDAESVFANLGGASKESSDA